MTAATPIPDDTRVDPSFVPKTSADYVRCLQSWEWRIFSGQLYKIMVKDDDHNPDEMGVVKPFIPNDAQRLFLSRLHTRNVILKARQLGFTTLICILWLDHALFQGDQRCAIIAHTMDDAAVILRDKVKFAYNNLPASVRANMPLKKDNATEIQFAHNNSAIRVAVSARSGTYHRLHVSEMGKIAAKAPDKAEEIVTGSFPAVPERGVVVVESTAEGQAGEFFRIANTAEETMRRKVELTPKTWAFHFFPWHANPAYQIAANDNVEISAKEHQYFDKIEVTQGVDISLQQRAWYVIERDQVLGGDNEKMWREYPSTSRECWQRSTEGTYYAAQIARMMAEGRITRLPVSKHVPVNTFWDIGSSDGTGIWLHQKIGPEHRFIKYIEGWEMEYAHFIKQLRDTGYIFGRHYLPHDAMQKKQLINRIASPYDMLTEAAKDWDFVVVPPVETLMHGINLTRQRFATVWIDPEECKEGLNHLTLYGKRWNKAMGIWSDEPTKAGGHTEAADAFRQWSQGYDGDQQAYKPARRQGSGFAA